MLRSVASNWSDWALSSLIGSGLVLLLVSVLWLAIRKRATPQLGYCLFLLVPLKLFVPVPIEWTAPRWLAQCNPYSSFHVARDESSADKGLATVFENIPAVLSQSSSSNDSALVDKVRPESHPVTHAPDVATVQSPLPSAEVQRVGRSVPRGPLKLLFTSTTLLLAWAAFVAFLFIRLVLAQRRLRHRMRDSNEPDPKLLALVVALTQRIGIAPVRVTIVSNWPSPAVCGFRRPVLALPNGLVESLSPSQLEWVLLHELAHVRRGDLLVSVFQRVAGILHFFNPAVWVANRAIDRLREYACDDFASVVMDGERDASGQAFLNVIQFASTRKGNHQLQSSGVLGLFEKSGKAAAKARLIRLLDSSRTVRSRWSLASIGMLLATAIIALPRLRGADEPAPPTKRETAPAEAKTSPPSVEPFRFEFKVVDPDGKPLPGVEVHVRPNPDPRSEDWSITTGEKIRDANYGPIVKANDTGVLAFELRSGRPNTLSLNVTTDGYAPFWAEWRPGANSEPIPASYTAQLDAGATIVGQVVDDDGKAVAGVEIGPSIAFKKREGDLSDLHMGKRLKTDADGKWTFGSVPASYEKLTIELDHPDFVSRYDQIPSTSFRRQGGDDEIVTTVLSRGVTVSGRVTDQNNSPVAGAIIRTHFQNADREATTDAEGRYQLVGCSAIRTELIVTAKGYGPDLKSLKIEPGQAPVDFRLEAGRHLQVRVVDEAGRPVPGSRIFLRSWRADEYGRGLGMQLIYTDASGVWEWNDAPADEIVADICPADGMQIGRQTLMAREEEYLYTRIPPLVISGKIIDRKTRQPVEECRVITGRRTEGGMLWERSDQFAATGGQFQVRKSYPAERAYRIRVEAPGYKTYESKDIANDAGAVDLEIEMESSPDLVMEVLTPDGKPAAQAEIALGVPGSQITIRDGFIRKNATFCDRRQADAEGRFSIPHQSAPYELIVLHESGFAHVHADPKSPPQAIPLEAWARVEGVYRIGLDAGADVPLSLSPAMFQSESEAPSLTITNEGRTNAEGGFSFDRVVPGATMIGRSIEFNVSQHGRGMALSHTLQFNARPGQDTTLELGGTGRPVIGQLRAPAGVTKEVDWNFAFVDMDLEETLLPDPPIPPAVEAVPERRKECMAMWLNSTEGAAWKKLSNANQERRGRRVRYCSPVGADGRFRIDDVPAERYSMSIRLTAPPEERFALGRAIGFLQHHIEIPAMPEGRSDEPLDLGTLTLQKVE